MDRLKEHHQSSLREITVESGMAVDVPTTSNQVHPGKYTRVTFLPLALAEQLLCLSSLWFVVVIVLEANPFQLDYQPGYGTLGLFAIHVGLGLAKQGITTYRGFVGHIGINNQTQPVWDQGSFKSKRCEDVKVGDCVLLNKEVRVPADMLLLAVSGNEGACHISTTRPLGEHDLVVKSALRETQRLLVTPHSPETFNFERLNAVIKVSPPDEDYLSFSGSILLKHVPRALPLRQNNFLLRGSTLKGEGWMLGLALYVGRETKHWSNLSKSRRKSSLLERTLNQWIVVSSGVAVLFAALMILVQYTASQKFPNASDFVSYLLQCSPLVPVGLYIGLDVLRLIHACLSSNSSRKIHVSCPMEDLGAVSHLLVDKTGTVTQGRYELLEVLVGWQCYSKTSTVEKESELSFLDLQKQIQVEGPHLALRQFCECILLCNGQEPMSDGSLRGTSVDEEAILKGLRDLGFTICERSDEEIIITAFEECVQFRVICMSGGCTEGKKTRILVKLDSEESRAVLYVKGQYENIKHYLTLPEEEKRILEGKLERMSQKGLRTAVLCYRVLEGNYLSEIESRINLIKSLQSTHSNVEGNLEVLLRELEHHLTYLGVTGVKDQLQPGAALALETLQEVGVVPWLMSGEGEAHTLACAKEIGLVKPLLRVISLEAPKREDCIKRLKTFVDETNFQDCSQTEASAIRDKPSDSSSNDKPEPSFALSISGKVLEIAIRDDEAREMLLELLIKANAVCFCNMYPSHKRQAVQLLREDLYPSAVIMAAGDMVNDIPMMMEADISVAIRGDKPEWLSDIKVNSFAAVEGLILDSGRRSSTAIYRAMLVFLYAHIMLVFTSVILSLLANFTPTVAFSVEFRTLYGSVFIFLPIVFFGAFSKPVWTTTKLRQVHTLTWRCLLRCSFVGTLQAICVSLFLLSACYDRSSSDVSTSILSCLYQLALVGTISIHCGTMISGLWPVRSSMQVLSFGSLCLALWMAEDEAEELRVALTTPRFVLALLGPMLTAGCISHGVSRRYMERNQCQPSDSKVIPLVDMQHIRKNSRSLSSKLKPAKPKQQIAPFALQSCFCFFQNTQTERKFQTLFLQENMKVYWLLLIVVLLQTIVPFVLDFLLNGSSSSSIPFTTALVVSCVLFMASFTIRNLAQCSSALFAISITATTFALNIALNSLNASVFLYVSVCLLIFLREKWLPNMIISIISTVFLIVSESKKLDNKDTDAADVFCAIWAICIQILIVILSGQISRQNALQAREQFRLVQESIAKIQESDTILNYLLPDFICNQVKDGVRYIAENQGQVTVIFIEICDFEEICVKYKPKELMEFLDEVFQRMDEICFSLHVAKIETVGKTYLACAGLRDFEFEHTGECVEIPHAQRALELSFAILRNFKSTWLQDDRPLSFKIGICSGPVIAGVVGCHKPQFVLVGDTVNTASRMASSLVLPNTVQITSSTYKLVKELSQYEFKGKEVKVKGKGIMETYLVSQSLHPHSRIPLHRATQPARHPQRRHMSLSLSDVQALHTFTESVQVHQVCCLPAHITSQEAEFRKEFAPMMFPLLRLALIMLSGLTFAMLAAKEITGIYLVTAIFAAVIATGSAVLVVFLRKIYEKRWFGKVVMLICVSSSLLALDPSNSDEMRHNCMTFFLSFLIIMTNFASGLLFQAALLSSILITTPHLYIITTSSHSAIQNAVFCLLFTIQCCILRYFTEKNQRKHHITDQKAKREIAKTEQLLTHMIPFHAIENLKLGKFEADKIANVSILFADISGFTSWASTHSPGKVIDKLSAIFTAFDQKCVRKQLYKVCTIGDCYVALSSSSHDKNRDPVAECVRMVQFAFDMVDIVEQVSQADGENLKMRIGVHVGEVVAGITGSRIVRYDIYGPDVAIANRMESSGAVGRVNVSSTAKALLESTHSYGFKYNTTVEVVNRRCDAYFLCDR